MYECFGCSGLFRAKCQNEGVEQTVEPVQGAPQLLLCCLCHTGDFFRRWQIYIFMTENIYSRHQSSGEHRQGQGLLTSMLNSQSFDCNM